MLKSITSFRTLSLPDASPVPGIRSAYNQPHFPVSRALILLADPLLKSGYIAPVQRCHTRSITPNVASIFLHHEDDKDRIIINLQPLSQCQVRPPRIPDIESVAVPAEKFQKVSL